MFKWLENTSSSIPRRYHVLFWIGYFIFNVVRWGSYFDDYLYSVQANLIEFPLHIILVYFNIYFLIPKFILKKKYKEYILIFSLALILLYFIRTGIDIYFFSIENVWPESYASQDPLTFNHVVAVILGELYVIALATTIKLTVDWIYERKRAERLQEIQMKTELNFLKSQIQPHFFFNTLNNLYALTLEKSDVAPSVVLKLSDIMQYVLYDVRTPRIRLYDEIKFIQNHIDLVRLRYGDRMESNTDIIGQIDDVKVPPLLFLPFIENCFKHGIKEDDHLEVDIYFENVDDKYLIFKVENPFNKLAKKSIKHGIGIENVKRRLELLFKKDYYLKTSLNEQRYCVELKIPIQ